MENRPIELKPFQLVQALKAAVALLECDRLESCSDCYLRFVDCEKVEKECAEAIKSVLNDAGYPYPGESSHSEEAWNRRANDGKAKGLENAPTVDAVEVVRCKDCKHAYINKYSAASGVALCRLLTKRAGSINFVMEHDDFCSYGERRSDNADD